MAKKTTLLLLFLLAPACVFAAADSWWNNAWKYRVPVRLAEDPVKTSGGGARPAAAQFVIPDGCHANGHDVRVVSADGKLCKSKLMYFEPAVYGWVAFEAMSGRDYFVYLGNPKAAKIPETWEPQAGVFLQTWLHKNTNNAQNWKQFSRLFEEATVSCGASFRTKIYDGFNPYGEPEHYLSMYTAWFRVPQAGTYCFSTASQDASFVFIDGKPVCEWPGIHGVHGGLRGEHNGKVQLSGGAHKLEYYQAHLASGEHFAMAAWKEESAKLYRIMEPEAFVPILVATTGLTQEREALVTPSFGATQVEWMKQGFATFTVWDFNEFFTGRGSNIVERTWTFSDGMTFKEPKFRRVFLHSGDFDVTLSVKTDQGQTGTFKRKLRVMAVDKMEKTSDAEVSELFLSLVRAMPLDKLGKDDLAAVGDYFKAMNYGDKTVEIYGRMLNTDWNKDKKVNVPLLQEIIRQVLNKDFPAPEKQEPQLREWVGRIAQNDPARVVVMAEFGKLQLKINLEQDAYTTFKAASLAAGASGRRNIERDVLIGLGDACRLMKKRDEAREAYRKAEAIPTGARETPFDVSSYALTVEAYLARREYKDAEDTITKWLTQYPTENMVGYASILRARLYGATKRRAEGIRELEAFLGMDPRGIFAQGALEELADQYAAGTPDERMKARPLYDKILTGYQDEKVRARVTEKLSKLK